MQKSPITTAAQAVIISYVLSLGALAMHEVSHLVLLHLMGGSGGLFIVPWRLGLVNYYIYGLHVEPLAPLTVSNQAVLNFLGPLIAVIPLALLLEYERSRIVRVALVSNILILVFFAVLEAGYELLEAYSGREVGVLGSPEFNIGVPLMIILYVVYRGIWMPDRVS